MPKLPFRLSLRVKFSLVFLLSTVGSLALILVSRPNFVAGVIMMLVLLGALFLAVIFINSVAKPIEALKSAALRFGQGDFNVKVDIKTNDEIEDLANGFNQMGSQLNTLITALKKEREVLSAERNKLSVIVSGITDAVIAVDLSRKIIIFNPAAEGLTGYTQEEVLGRPIEEVIRLFEEGEELLPTYYCPVNNTNIEGISVSKKSVVVMGKKKGYASLVAGQIKDGSSVNLGCILTLHNSTEEMNLEKMKLDFVSMAAHELRTPLTSVRGYISILQNEVKMDAEHRQFLDRSMIAAMQLNDLVENLLSVSKIERGALAISKQPVDWVADVKAAVGELVQRAKEKNIDLTFQSPTQTIPYVHVDKLRVNEVVNNLVSNAINYTKPGGSIKVWLEAKDNLVLTHVSDTGQGVPKEALPHLFTKFFRVSGPLGQGSKGTGLGLYISRSIVEMHGGKIWADSEIGKGSTFTFSLPAAAV